MVSGGPTVTVITFYNNPAKWKLFLRFYDPETEAGAQRNLPEVTELEVAMGGSKCQAVCL